MILKFRSDGAFDTRLGYTKYGLAYEVLLDDKVSCGGVWCSSSTKETDFKRRDKDIPSIFD